MRKTALKLRSKRGETLVEMLVSIVLLGLSISIMAVMLTTAYKMNRAAREADGQYYVALSSAERQSEDDKIGNGGKVSISYGTKKVEVSVDFYGGDSLRSYSTAP